MSKAEKNVGTTDGAQRLAVFAARLVGRERSSSFHGSLSDVFTNAISFVNSIQNKPISVQVSVGTAVGWITGYVFTKGSKILAGVIGCTLIFLQFLETLNISQMNQKWEHVAEVIAVTKPYFRYLFIPLGLYAVNRVLCSLVPGPQNQPRLNLRNRTVLITGASSGLGRELAVRFYRSGAKVILTARSIEKLKEICEELKAMSDVNNSNEPVYKYLDICDPNGIEELVLLAINHRIDVLVNNAGLSMRGSCKDTPMSVHRQVMEVNYFGHIAVTKALLDYIPEDGAVVYISSLQGRIAVPFRCAYSASKHAAQAFFDCLRGEERHNTQILVVSATYLNTGFGRRALDVEGKAMEVDDSNQAKGLEPSYAAACIVEALFCNCRRYIKIDQSKVKRDIIRLRKDVARVLGNKRGLADGEISDFLRDNVYLLGSFFAGYLLGYSFA